MSKRVLIPFRHKKKLQPYVDAVQAAGMDVLPGDVAEPVKLDGVQGLLLMGGTDVNPRLYGAEPQPETEEPDEQRDAAEIALIQQALVKDLPILAICRGLQILNVSSGGTLIQHLPSAARHDIESENKAAPSHEVVIDRNSRLSIIAGKETWSVNSRHHQAAGRIGSGLRVVARDTQDGTVEALERDDKRFVLAVQWHPEDQVRQCPEQAKLFREFAVAL
jgi:putative glutamine amidotransferase